MYVVYFEAFVHSGRACVWLCSCTNRSHYVCLSVRPSIRPIQSAAWKTKKNPPNCKPNQNQNLQTFCRVGVRGTIAFIWLKRSKVKVMGCHKLLENERMSCVRVHLRLLDHSLASSHAHGTLGNYTDGRLHVGPWLTDMWARLNVSSVWEIYPGLQSLMSSVWQSDLMCNCSSWLGASFWTEQFTHR